MSIQPKTRYGKKTMAALLLALTIATASPLAFGNKKKKTDTPAAPAAPTGPLAPDFRQVVVFPTPPAIARVKYLDYFSAEKPDFTVGQKKEKPKQSWMDRMAGVSPDAKNNPDQPKKRFQLLTPYGMAEDSKGLLYVADAKVGAIFIFNPETSDLDMIKHGVHAKFGTILGLVTDDNDDLFVSDGQLHHILVFNGKHEAVSSFGDDVMVDPNGMALDLENRFLYVADTGLDQVLVYDADSHKLLRRIGTTGKNHTLIDAGNFSKPTNVAVDKDGDVYVSDTWNDRIEEFDADGTLIRTWGKNGDGPGEFARPKGIAIDPDGHVWVADAMLNRIQVFTPEGRYLLGFGGFGMLPGQFQSLTGLFIDKKNRVFTSEHMLGRVQMYRYVDNTEAKAQYEQRQAELDRKAKERDAGATKTAAVPSTAETKPATETKPTSVPSSAANAAVQPATTAPPSSGRMKLPDAPVPAQPDKATPPNQ